MITKFGKEQARMNGDNNKKQSMDDFWDLGSIVPKKRASSAFDESHTQAVEIEIPTVSDGSAPSRGSTEEKIEGGGVIKRYIHPHTEESERRVAPDEEYAPSNSLIHKVSLYSWSSPLVYYDRFRKSAIYYYNKTTTANINEPYFSYMPQYSQLNDAQLATYLRFRSEVRRGNYPIVDYSYILLLIYETINLSDKIPPERSLSMLSNLWLNYRYEYPRLDAQLSEWIFDLCLIKKLPPPASILDVVGKALPATAGLREFYADSVGNADAFVSLLLCHCSNYDYRKSKFAVGENCALYEKHMSGVLRYIVAKASDPSHPFEAAGLKLQDSKTKRDAFTGALCCSFIKKRIDIEYCSFSHSHELRFIITDILKYAENRIRAHIGVKSRLSVNILPDGIKRLADEYFASELPIRVAHPSIPEEIPEYEKLYEPTSSGLSLESASMIEELSWETTGKLVEAFDGEEPEQIAEPDPMPEVVEDEASLWEILNENEINFIRAALDEDFARQSAVAMQAGSLPDILADKINTLAADTMGDILLEDIGGGYAVLEDYIEETKGAINNDQ